jgi:hypothetical protein
MSETLKSVLQSGARRYLEGEMSMDALEQGIVMAIAEAPEGLAKREDLAWLAKAIASAID